MIPVIIGLVAAGTAAASVLTRYYRPPLTVKRTAEHALMALALCLVSMCGLDNPVIAPLCKLCLVAAPLCLAGLLLVVVVERKRM
jgi:hypothetical protein